MSIICIFRTPLDKNLFSCCSNLPLACDIDYLPFFLLQMDDFFGFQIFKKNFNRKNEIIIKTLNKKR